MARRGDSVNGKGLGAAWLLGGLLFAGSLTSFASIGGPHDAIEGLVAVLASVLIDGAWAWAYLAAAAGWGVLAIAGLQRLGMGRVRELWALRVAMGLGVLLSLSHGLAWLGAMGGGRGVAIAVIGVGLAGLVWGVIEGVRSRQAVKAPTLWWLLAAPAAALLLVAASQPPGWLWGSEAGGYDALSYHLRLPQEWIDAGRLAPLEHCVYSYLPGYVEAAMTHVGIASGATARADADRPLWGLLENGGRALITMQMLHAGVTILAAWVVSRLASLVLRQVGVGGRGAARASAIAGAATLATPWTIVVGSLAYNDMAMVLLGAGAMLAAIEPKIRAWGRGLLVGALVGLACGAKPTAIFFFTPIAGLMMVGWVALRMRGAGDPRSKRVLRQSVGVSVVVAAMAGIVSLSPWLVRNAARGGNPVFPAMTGVFGSAHWDEEQVERWAGAHRFDGSLGDRLALVVRPDADAPGGPAHRGMLHAQWGALWPAAVAALGVALARHRTRAWGSLVATGLVALVVAWLLLTHVQSRFLIPALAPIGALIGLATAPDPRGCPKRAWVAAIVGALLVVAQSAVSVGVFARQRTPAGPNYLLVPGPAWSTGQITDTRAVLPEAWLNFDEVARAGKTLVVGDAATLYYATPIAWTTTWDTSRLGALTRQSDDMGAWRERLLGDGFAYVLVDWSELQRLTDAGWHDPSVTPELVARFVTSEATRVRGVGEESGAWRLYRLRGAP